MSIAFLASCANKKWEYKTVSINGCFAGETASPTFCDPSSMLNELGKEGWELVGTYTEIKTVFPNFGREEYVTGIRTNTATNIVNFVLKREVGMVNNHSEE